MKNQRHILNDQIRSKEVRVIDHDGTQLGVLSLKDALSQAESNGLDLLLVSPNSEPPVCRILNYGQYQYQQRKKEKQAKKANKQHIVKELKLSPKISSNDFMVRVKRGIDFLGKGYKVKCTVAFRGREIVHLNLGMDVINRFLEALSEVGAQDSEISRAHRSLTVMLRPK